jgi:hypothetical protein
MKKSFRRLGDTANPAPAGGNHDKDKQMNKNAAASGKFLS